MLKCKVFYKFVLTQIHLKNFLLYFGLLFGFFILILKDSCNFYDSDLFRYIYIFYFLFSISFLKYFYKPSLVCFVQFGVVVILVGVFVVKRFVFYISPMCKMGKTHL